MSEWNKCTLGDAITLQRGHDLPKIKMKNGIVPVAGSNGIIGNHNLSTTKAPGITIGRSGNIGNAYFYKDDFWAHNTTLYVKDFKGNDEKFIYYFLKSFDFKQFNVGSAVPTLNRNHIHPLEILLPPLEEQRAIASVLSSLDDKIDLLSRQNKTLEAMAETLFRQWFIEDAQEDWTEYELGDLLTITSSKRIFYNEYVPFGVPFYRSKEIIELHNSGNIKNDLFITEERFKQIEKGFGVPQKGDILLTSVGTLGIPYRVKEKDRFYFKDGNLTWFKDFDGISSIIIYCWLKSSIGREQLDSITIGSTQAALTISGLKKLTLKIPPSGKIKELETQLNLIYKKVELNQLQTNTLKKKRDKLLPKLMSREVSVKYD